MHRVLEYAVLGIFTLAISGIVLAISIVDAIKKFDEED